MSKKIVLVEHEEIIYNLLLEKLKKEGYDVSLVKDGSLAIKTIKENNPDLVLIDILLPNKNGLELIEEIKKDNDLREKSIIVISNSGQPAEIEKAKKLGAVDWIIKTEFNLQNILEKIKKQIS